MKDLTLVFPPHPRSDAIEERYAARQSRLLLTRQAPAAATLFFEREESAAAVASRAQTELLLVLTDPLLVAPPHAVSGLDVALAASEADASVPLLNESANARQRAAADVPYLTLRQFERASAGTGFDVVEWDGSDPGLFLCRRADLLGREVALANALQGRPAAITREVFCHRFYSLRGQLRGDLLERVPLDARSILEFGCGEGALGSALRARQPCRVVGIEMEEEAAAVAERRLDAVHRGDVRQLVTTIDETFDCIVGGDILEHLDDPWTFLADLRRLARPGASLLLSVPNIASWPIVADLLAGRFDYIYMGITCAGHLRFFTRRSIEEMLEMSGWSAVRIEPQPAFITPEFDELRRKLDSAGIAWSEEILTPGYYVFARA